MRGLPISVPMSESIGLDLDHVGVIYYPHDRLYCCGCIANRELRREMDEAIEAFAKKIDDTFLNKDRRL